MADNDPPQTTPAPPPTLTKLRAALLLNQNRMKSARKETEFKGKFKNQSIETQAEYEHFRGIRDYYNQKRLWSYFLMLLMLAMIGFQSYLLVKVGLGVWNFTEYSWLLPALLVQNLGQIVGLSVFVVKSLFK